MFVDIARSFIIYTCKYWGDDAYQKDFSVMPVDWYDSYISETIKSLRQSPQIARYADDMMNRDNEEVTWKMASETSKFCQ